MLLLILAIISCNNSNEELILNNDYSYHLVDGEGLKGNIYRCNDINEFNNFLNTTSLSIEDESVALIFYTENSINTSNDILEKGQKINYLSVFTLKNGKLKHQLLEKQTTSEYNFIEEFDLSCNDVSTNTARFMLSWVKGKQLSNRDITNYHVIISPEAKRSRITTSLDELILKTKTYSYKVASLNNRHRDPVLPSDDCDECQDNGCECVIGFDDSGDDPVFDPNVTPYNCMECCTQNRAKYDPDVINNFSTSFIDTYYDHDLYWSFKDNIMDSSNIGIKYVNYYRGLSAFILSSDNLTANHLISTTSKMPSIHSIVTKLMSPTTSSDEIIVTTSIERDLKDLIALYRNFSTNADFQFILDDIENDIDLFSNKTYNEVLDLIQM
ncbi:MAG: hypothetical protein ACPGXZ_09305 [Saprospiraceae bacterium]